MPVIKVHDKVFETFLSEETIQKRVKELAAAINNDYKGKRPLFIAILNGAFMFASDLFKEITIDAEICFIKLASYKGTRSTGNVITSIGLDEPLLNRHVVIIEDIVDTGNTLHQLRVARGNPAEHEERARHAELVEQVQQPFSVGLDPAFESLPLAARHDTVEDADVKVVFHVDRHRVQDAGGSRGTMAWHVRLRAGSVRTHVRRCP